MGEFVSFLKVSDAKRVEETAAANLELHHVLALLNLHRLGICTVSLLKEVTNVTDLLGLQTQTRIVSKSYEERDIMVERKPTILTDNRD